MITEDELVALLSEAKTPAHTLIMTRQTVAHIRLALSRWSTRRQRQHRKQRRRAIGRHRW